MKTRRAPQHLMRSRTHFKISIPTQAAIFKVCPATVLENHESLHVNHGMTLKATDF